MGSESRIAQGQLTQLEKDAAPFDDQLLEAAKFVGVDLDKLGVSAEEGVKRRKLSGVPVYHGKEEWLLRWLLKRLQAKDNDIPRRTAASWRLLRYLLETIPISKSAQILVERQFIQILRRSLEDLQKNSALGTTKPELDVVSADEGKKSSKKRKRSGETVISSSCKQAELPVVLEAICSTLDLVMKSSKAISTALDEGQSAFSAEYMKTTTRATAEDASKILGSWLVLCHQGLQAGTEKIQINMEAWLVPFIEIWDSHSTEEVPQAKFSAHCIGPVLSLLQALKSDTISAASNWVSQLEKLVARNIMIPARAKQETEPDLLDKLTRPSIVENTRNSAVLFDIAIRSIQLHGKRRKSNDESWLQKAFKTFLGALPAEEKQQNVNFISAMLQSAIDHKLNLDLLDLRSITAKFGLRHDGEDWHLLATIIKLDANVFLIPNEEENLLDELLKHITKASVKTSWTDIMDQVVLEILVPLMREFAQARDLSGFIHHWFAQLVKFETLRLSKSKKCAGHFSAWEDEALQIELKKLLEPSLTTQQIVQLLDWLSPQALENPAATCVILEAIAGSISQEDVVDAVALRLYDLLCETIGADDLDARYRWRSWRVMSRPIHELVSDDLDHVSDLWEKEKQPFNSIANIDTLGGQEALEVLRFLCASWTAAKTGSQLEIMVKPVLLGMLRHLANDISMLPHLVNTTNGSDKKGKITPLYGGMAWLVWPSIQLMIEEYPKVLQLGLEMDGDSFQEMIRAIFRFASLEVAETPKPYGRGDHLRPSDLWLSALRHDAVLNNEALLEIMIDIMLDSQTCIVAKTRVNNSLAIRGLLQLPLEVVTRPMKERILKGWLPASDGEGADNLDLSLVSTALDPSVLSLKVQTMRRPMIYEGMAFSDYSALADNLAESDIPHGYVNVALLKELVSLTLAFAYTNADQARNKTYIEKAFRIVQKKTRKAAEKKKHQLNYGLIAIFEVALSAFRTKIGEEKYKEIISEADLNESIVALKSSHVVQLKEALSTPEDEKSSKRDLSDDHRYLTILSILNAFNTLGVDASQVMEFESEAKCFIASGVVSEFDIAQRLETFISIHAPNTVEEALAPYLEGDLTTSYGRKAVLEKIQTAMTGQDNEHKVKFLQFLLKSSAETVPTLNELLAAREVVISIEDNHDADESTSEGFNLPFAYNLLCGQLWKTSQPQQFFLISDILDIMLRTKAHSMTQFNIDSTLGCITIICSRNGPHLPPTRAGDIYLRLCQLIQSILTNHRLKLQGHFHLLVQLLITLLRCLFAPLAYGALNTNEKFGAPPSWLSSPHYQLTTTHAQSFVRLLTLLCNPTVSSVRTSKQNALSSATDKAKRMAGQHMKFLLQAYIKLQLEMRMMSEIREAMKPGLYAIFDTTTVEGRRGLTDSLDASGRAVYGELYRDYLRFGKWKGN